MVESSSASGLALSTRSSSFAHRRVSLALTRFLFRSDSFRGAQGGEQDAQRRVFLRAELEVYPPSRLRAFGAPLADPSLAPYFVLPQVWDKYTSGYFFWTLKKDDGWDAGVRPSCLFLAFSFNTFLTRFPSAVELPERMPS